MTPNLDINPDIKVSVKQTFGIDSKMEVEAFSKKSEYVPEIDKNYKFDRDTTLAIISGFAFNKRVLVQGYHGTGKSTHIEQIAARLNWPWPVKSCRNLFYMSRFACSVIALN